MFTPIISKELPSSRKSMPKTILLISTHDIARIFIVEKYDIHELAPLHTEDTEYKYSDKEGFSYVSNGSGSDI